MEEEHKMKNNKDDEKQMSESMVLGAILSLVGGFQDAYSYNGRGEVFANAQTGNVVLFGQNLVSGNWFYVARYAMPILAFLIGIYLSEWVRYYHQERESRFHWRQIVLLVEMMMMIIVGFLPQQYNMAANILLSFACAIQVNSFRKFDGIPCATTMCIGNMRSGTECLSHYMITKEKKFLQKSLKYYSIILFFAIGAILGFVITVFLGQYAIWVAAGMAVLGLAIMFR